MDHNTESREDARAGLIKEHQPGQGHGSSSSLSGFSQFRLIMNKNAKLKWRSGSDLCCEALAPLLLIFGLSCLSLTVSSDSHSADAFYTSSIRDTSVTAMFADRLEDVNQVYNSHWHIKNRMGQILFASDAPAYNDSMTVALCASVISGAIDGVNSWNSNQQLIGELNDNWNYIVVDSAYGCPQIPSQKCIKTLEQYQQLCSSQFVLGSTQELDDRALSLAGSEHYSPVIGGVVVKSFDGTAGVEYDMRFNRSYVSRTSYETDPFNFYPSSFWMQYTSSGFLMVQGLVENHFIHEIGNLNTTLTAYFQSFPHEEWKYNPFKMNFLNGNFQQFFGYCIIFALSTLVKGIVEEEKRKIKEGHYLALRISCAVTSP
jgi:hypothetical protein